MHIGAGRSEMLASDLSAAHRSSRRKTREVCPGSVPSTLIFPRSTSKVERPPTKGTAPPFATGDKALQIQIRRRVEVALANSSLRNDDSRID